MIRLISGIVLASAAVAAIRFLPLGALLVVAAVIALLAAHEYLRIAGTVKPSRQFVPLVATLAVFTLVATGATIDPILLLLAALAIVAIDVLATARPLQAAMTDLLAPVYVGLPMALLVRIHELRDWPATLFLVALVVVSDSSQYYAGRTFGRHPLAPAISPKKTIEGAAGGMLGGVLFMTLVGARLFPGSTIPVLALLGATLVALGIAGDLFESRLKRAAAMKDSSALIPGHGGVLDRIDALLFAVPAFYLYLHHAP